MDIVRYKLLLLIVLKFNIFFFIEFLIILPLGL